MENDNVNTLLQTSFIWSNKKNILKFLTRKPQVRFAIFCAEQVFHLNSNETREVADKAVTVVKLYLEDRATKEECATAAAYAAAYAADAADAAAYAATDAAAYVAAYVADAAAYAAAYAADAADAADAAAAAADAAADAAVYAAVYAAADAAADAADAAYAAAVEQLKQEQMTYLRELIIEELPEEYRDNWLLIASI